MVYASLTEKFKTILKHIMLFFFNQGSPYPSKKNPKNIKTFN